MLVNCRPIPLDAEELRAVLAGVWRADPFVLQYAPEHERTKQFLSKIL